MTTQKTQHPHVPPAPGRPVLHPSPRRRRLSPGQGLAVIAVLDRSASAGGGKSASAASGASTTSPGLTVAQLLAENAALLKQVRANQAQIEKLLAAQKS